LAGRHANWIGSNFLNFTNDGSNIKRENKWRNKKKLEWGGERGLITEKRAPTKEAGGLQLESNAIGPR